MFTCIGHMCSDPLTYGLAMMMALIGEAKGTAGGEQEID